MKKDLNGYIGGATGGVIQSYSSKSGLGLAVGGGIGCATSTAITGALNNIDPDSTNSPVKEIITGSLASGIKGLSTGAVTQFIGFSVDNAISNPIPSLSGLTKGFGTAINIFFGWLDDAAVYAWE